MSDLEGVSQACTSDYKYEVQNMLRQLPAVDETAQLQSQSNTKRLNFIITYLQLNC